MKSDYKLGIILLGELFFSVCLFVDLFGLSIYFLNKESVCIPSSNNEKNKLLPTMFLIIPRQAAQLHNSRNIIVLSRDSATIHIVL